MKYEEQISRFISEREDQEKRGLTKETSIRHSFHHLVQSMFALDSQYNGYKITIEESNKTHKGRQIYYDATIQKNGARLGVIENKDAQDDLAKELASKKASHYDLSNALLENGHEVWLIREGEVLQKVVYFTSHHATNKKYYQAKADLEAFSQLLERFLANTSEQEQLYNEALINFEQQVPYWASVVKQRIDQQLGGTNSLFKQKIYHYYEDLKVAISEHLALDDVKEVLIQHILTIDLFEEIVGVSEFRRKNTIAKIMEELTDALDPVMARSISKELRNAYRPLNASINELGDDVSYKVDVLKSFYQQFYHSYNTDDKDKLGIIYTPVEIIQFMINSTNIMLKEFFGKTLANTGVNILDPCTGTGSFIVMLMQYMKDNHLGGNLAQKFSQELWANELSILSYYIAIMHIELMYEELTGEFAYFKNLSFADTLANKYAVQQSEDGREMESTIFDANTQQIKLQNSQKIQVIIGNPPYRANQKSGNENKQNNKYSYIDSRIDNTYIANNDKTVAVKLKIKDMYTRFIRWASDRIAGEGMVAFVTNRSYLDALGFNGFRASVAKEFSHIYIVDLGGDIRKNAKLSGPKHNVFAIQTGVAIVFLMKTDKSPANEGIYYLNPFAPDELASAKLEWLANRSKEHILRSLPWQLISPNAKHFWLEQSDAFESMISLGDKYSKNKDSAQALFYLYSLGIATNRDSWMYDIDQEQLTKKIGYFIDECYKFMPQAQQDATIFPETIQANRKLIGHMAKGQFDILYQAEKIVTSLYRPFTKRYYYYQNMLTEATGQMPSIFPTGKPGENLMICIIAPTQRVDFTVLVSNSVIDLNFFRDPAQCFPLYRYTADGEKISNINPAYKAQFEAQGALSDDQMFAYVYAMLHHPRYRSEYEIDLKQNLPSVPVSPAVAQYVALGQALIELHLDYELAVPYAYQRDDQEAKLYSLKLKSNPAAGTISIDSTTTLSGIPSQAWDYKLGNRSAIDWVLEGYSIKKNVSTTTANGAIADPDSDLYTQYGYQPYQFSHHKEAAIALVAKVITVSLQTQAIIADIAQLPLE